MTNKQEKLKQLFPEDLFEVTKRLSENEVDVLVTVQAGLEKHLRPVITEHTEKGEFPFAAFTSFVQETQLLTDPRLYKGRKPQDRLLPSQYYTAFLWYLLARFDTSISTFCGVHAGLGYYSFLLGGSEEQIAKWAPRIQRFELQTCFGLTEPEHGSDVAGGLDTTATRKGDTWVINGEKRWIGGAATADILPIYARDTADNKVKCFIVKKGQHGLKVDKIENKIALRMVQNGHIYLENVQVAEVDRLQNINGFKDVARILYATRSGVASIAAGVTSGAFLAALDYVKGREQFGKKLSSYQLIQEKLARLQANVSAELALCAVLADIETQGHFDEVRSSIGKMNNALRMRESVALAREICGGNGIVLDYDVGRFFQDGEAIYSYEGTHEINALVIGRAITGESAFL